MVTKKKDAYDVPSILLKEIQRTIALVVVDKLLSSSSMKLADQQDFCYKQYHGSPDSDDLGQVPLFLQGRLHFKDAFDETHVDVTENDATANRQRFMKTVLTQDNDNLLRVGKHLTIGVITRVSKKKADKISGRQIKTTGELAKKNILKATAIADAYCKNTECEKGPSGSNIADLYHQVLERMYADDLATGGENKHPDNNAPDEYNNEEQAGGEKQLKSSKNKLRPDKWIFPGFMGFVLFGTYSTTKDNVLSILKASDFPKKGISRRDGRMSIAAQKDQKRSKEACCTNSKTDSPFRRDIVLENRHKLAVLEQQEKRIQAKDGEHMCTLLVEMIKAGLASNDQQFRLATIFGKSATTGLPDETHPHWVSYLRGVEEVASKTAQLQELKDRIDCAKEQSGTKHSLASRLLSSVEPGAQKPKNKKREYNSTPNTKRWATDTVSSLANKSSTESKRSSESSSCVPIGVVQDNEGK